MVSMLIFTAVTVFRSTCNHIMNALNKVDVLDIGFNELSTGSDTVVNVLFLLRDFSEPFPYFIAHSIANLGGKFVH